MTTYFIAGYSRFPDGNQWNFWRVVNMNDKLTPQEVITMFYDEFEKDSNNYRKHPMSSWTDKGDVIITAFNKV
jgi:hypothetical protein